MQRMGIVLSATPVSFASKGAHDAIFIGNLTLSHVTVLDELFLVTNSRAGRRALFSDGGGGSRNQQRAAQLLRLQRCF